LATLKPRTTAIPQVSGQALSLFESSLVWDNLLPWGPSGRHFRSNAEDIDRLLRRFRQVGVNVCSLSVSGGGTIEETICSLGRARRKIAERSDWMILAESIADIRRAKAESRLAVNFNFQDAMPFENSLDMVWVYYDLGVRQSGLAYNLRNRVADGCAEESNGGLSRFGRSLIQEMNRAGMLVDGSHAGHHSSIEAMELCSLPFIFSHSNPYSIRPHYRSIKDDQIKACAVTGGVIGINGVGFWVGDLDASTDAIFRCLDYTVELVGWQHVGLGFDYIDDIEGLITSVEETSLAWPPFRGEPMVKHNYAGPEQIVELTQIMLTHGYPVEAITGILGENWARVYEQTQEPETAPK